MSTKKITVEVIGCNSCTGYSEKIPEVVRRFTAETNIEVEFRTYRAWEIDTGANIPSYIWEKIKQIRAGKDHPWGFFLNGNWISITPHRANEILLISCLAGGSVYGLKYSGIGIATKMIRQAMMDAKQKGYQYIESKPHDPGIDHVLKRLGFQRIDWPEGAKSPFPDPAFYRLDLSSIL